MCRLFFAICAIMLVSLGSQAQINDTVIDTSSDPVLNELQIIRGIHEETRNQRKRAIEERQRRDSLQNRESEEDLMSDYGVMARIEDNTHQRPMTDGWNLYGILAFAIAVISAAISWYTYKEQRKTEGNTKKMPQDTQRYLLNDLLRHLYRNYVKTYAMRTKMADIDYDGYPSEENYMKLKIPMENIHLDAFYGEDEKFRLMHVLYLNLRNYNEEVDVALKHATQRELTRETKDEDFDTLEFKVSLLTEKIITTIHDIWGKEARYDEEMRNALDLSISGKANAQNNQNTDDSGQFRHLTIDELKITAYSGLYSQEQLKEICETFNHDVQEERKKNERNAWKIRMIRFWPPKTIGISGTPSI